MYAYYTKLFEHFFLHQKAITKTPRKKTSVVKPIIASSLRSQTKNTHTLACSSSVCLLSSRHFGNGSMLSLTFEQETLRYKNFRTKANKHIFFRLKVLKKKKIITNERQELTKINKNIRCLTEQLFHYEGKWLLIDRF